MRQYVHTICPGTLKHSRKTCTRLHAAISRTISMLLVLIALAALSGCADSGSDYRPESYSADAAAVKTVQIDVRDRELEITASDDNQIHIAYYTSDKEAFDISVSDSGVLTMTPKTDKKWTDYIGGKADEQNRVITLQIPDGQLASLQLSTTNADISLPPLSVTDGVAATVNNGSIALEKLDVGRSLSLDAKNGNITGTIIGNYDVFDITSSVKKGNNNLPDSKKGGSKTLTAHANNGNISLDFVKE